MSIPRRRNANWEIVLYPGTTSSSSVEGKLAAVVFVEFSSYCRFCRREKSMMVDVATNDSTSSFSWIRYFECGAKRSWAAKV